LNSKAAKQAKGSCLKQENGHCQKMILLMAEAKGKASDESKY